MVQQYTLDKYPPELKKKLTLIKHFKTYLEGENQLERKPYNNKVDEDNDNQLVYVKKWMKTKHAIMFRLSNRCV